MNFPIPIRWRRAIALGLATLPAAAQASDPPQWHPNLTQPPVPARTARDIEVLHGTVKVAPIYRPAPVPVVPAESKSWGGAPAPVTPPPAPREEPKPAPPVIESRTIILAGYGGPFSQQSSMNPPNAPWLMPTGPQGPAAMPIPIPVMPMTMPAPAPAPAAAAQPTFVVIREPNGEPRPVMMPAPEPSRGVTIGNEALLGIGIGVAGLGFGFAGWRRRAAGAGAALRHPAPASPMGGDGVLLMGKYNAGPVPTTAEKFDIGPSYASQAAEKKKVEEQNQQAVLEFILNQNLALHAELAGPSDALPEATEFDPENN
jgi:hypothetical protein